MHRTIRFTWVLEEENRKKPCSTAAPPPPASQGSYIWTIRHTPIFLPNLGGEGVRLIGRKIQYVASVITDQKGRKESLDIMRKNKLGLASALY